MAHKTVVQRIREHAGLTRKQLGQLIGMSDASVWWFEEKGTIVPVERAYLLIDLAKRQGMHVTLEDFYAAHRPTSLKALLRKRNEMRKERERAAA